MTDPRAQISVDPDIKAPSTDQYSVGFEREIARNIGASISYVHKRARRQIGWRDTGGVFGTQTVTTPTGGTLTVFPLLNDPSARQYLRTNGPGYYARYNGVLFTLQRRYANRWTASANYTYSIASGLEPGGNTGRDPNDLIHRGGRLDPQDRPHLFQAHATYEIPVAETQVSANLTLTTGRPYGPQLRVRLPQGRKSIYFEDWGSFRQPNIEMLHIRVMKILWRRGPRRIELGAEIRNALQETSRDSLRSRLFTSSSFGLPRSYAIPRQLMFRIRGYW